MEVGQDVLGTDFKTFKPNGNNPEDFPVTEDKSLPNPTQEVSQEENLNEHIAEILEVIRILGDVHATVSCIIAINQRLACALACYECNVYTERGIEECHELSSVFGRQGQDKKKKTFIQDSNG